MDIQSKICKSGEGYEDKATIDIFVVDNCPENIICKKVKVLLLRMLQGMMHERMDLSNKKLAYKLLLVVTFLMGRLFTDNFKYKQFDRISKWGNNRQTSHVCAYNDLFKLIGLEYDYDILRDISIHKFEDKYFPITTKWDHYLSVQYGDYMTPPPEEKRRPEHI